MLSPRQVIEDIRRREYGIGLHAASPEAAVVRRMRAKLERAVQLLAGELYADGIHFVLELLQNAEDSEYDVWDEPFFRLVRRPDHLLVQYNEAGFREEEVRSLCDISRSTKSKAAGQIGEKGVGFKSVFRVSDNPQVFSGGYSFGFRRSDPDTGLGYVVPSWIDRPPPCVQAGLTNVYLPLRGDAQDEAARIADLEPSVLLFLKKLRTIEIIDEVSGRTRRVTRIDRGNNIELQDDGRPEAWRVFATKLKVPADCRDDRREGVEETEIVLAFPLTSKEEVDASRKPSLHAFLPVRPYGFRFVVQADFVLASSREEILKDRPWNRWLRDRLPEVFLRALAASRDDARLRNKFLSFVPLPGDLEDEFFKPVSERIIGLLKEDACILVEPGRWARPDQAITASEGARALFPGDDVRQLLGREFVAAGFQHALETLRTLGVAGFGLPETVRFLQWGEWLERRPDEWFARLFAFLGARLDHVRPRLEELRNTGLVPLEGGDLASPARGTIFLPLDRRAAYGFEHTMRVVRRTVSPPADAEGAASARKFLHALGVAKPDPTEMIEHHILPLFAGRMGPSDEATLVGALLYVKDHLAEYEKKDRTLARLKEGLLLRAGPGGPFVKAAELYLGAEYGNANGLETLFGGIGGVRFVSADYLELSLRRLAKPAGDTDPSEARRRREARAWREFLVRLGAEEWPRVKVQPATATAPARAWSDDLRQVFDTRERDRVALAFGLIDRRWGEYRKLLSVPERRRSGMGQPPPANVPSEFSRLLATAAWVPIRGGGLARPADAFLDTPASRQLLGDNVAYLDAPVRSRQLLDDLGIRRDPDTAAVLARLRALAEDGACDAAHLARLYGFLDRRFAADGEAIVAAFAGDPLVCLPGQPARHLRSGEPFWEAVPPAFGECGGLGTHWPGLEGFFVHRLGVRRSPSAEDHGRLLQELASRGEVEPAAEQTLWDVYEGLGLALARENVTGAGELPAWWEELIRWQVFLADRGGFRSNDGSLFVNDSGELHEVFRGRHGVWFLKLPGNDYPRFHRLVEAARLPFLSRSVKVEAVVPADRTRDVGMTARVRAAVPFLVRYLYFKEPATYRSLKGAGVLRRLGELSVYACDEVQAAASLNGVSVRLARDVASSFPAVFMRRECLSDTDALGVELARQLGDSSGLASFAGTVLSKPDADSRERMMKAHKIPPLPPENGVAGGSGDDRAREGGGRGDPGRAVVAVAAHAGDRDAEQDASDLGDAWDESADDFLFAGEAGEADQPAADVSRSAGRGQPPAHGATTGHRPPGGLAGHAVTARDWSPSCSPSDARVSYATISSAGDDAGIPRERQGEVGRGGRYSPGGNWPQDAVTDSPYAQPIGRWGEEYVVECLRHELLMKYPGATSEGKGDGWRIILNGQVVAEVTWLNSGEDQGAGHDIEVREGEARSYVEVKSTAGEARCSFELTEAQWRLAGQAGPAYRIARVFKAGKADARIAYVIDPVKGWLEGRLAVRVLRVVL
jgi:hypothetical protein